MEKESANDGSSIHSKESSRFSYKVAEFDKRMKEVQLYVSRKDWRKFKEFFAKDHQALHESVDWLGNTAMHLATSSNDPKLLRDLLSMIEKDHQRFEALRKKNTRGNTVLHHAIHFPNVKMLDVLLGYKDLRLRQPEEINSVGEDQRMLLQERNHLLETPVYRAARCGKIPMLVHLKKYYLRYQDWHTIHFPMQVPQKSLKSEKSSEENLKDCSGNSKNAGDSKGSGDLRNGQGFNSLYLAIAGQCFDLAMWLTSEVHGIEELGQEDRLACLRLLCQMPSCFQSHGDDMRSVEKLIYYLLPMPRYPELCYEVCDDDHHNCQRDESNDRIRKKDVESGEYSVKQPSSVLSRINRALWKFLAHEFGEIDRLWEKKRQHTLAEKLAKQLVKNYVTLSWEPTKVSHVTSPNINPPIVRRRNIIASSEKTHCTDQSIGHQFDSPLHLAASTGIVEIVKCIIEKYPEAIAHVEDGQNILHVALQHRQREIYRLIKSYGALKWLASELCNQSRTVLHQVARMDYYNRGNQAGVVFQLQDELLWFERVKKAIPPPLIEHCIHDKLTAWDLFYKEHEVMLKEAQDWIKCTAQSCSVVAVLVASVVFAAAYEDAPESSPLFIFFIIADAIALACSLISVTMFLSILTSPFVMKNFLWSLPRKLELGFTLLFGSLTFTLLAFSSTILITIGMDKDEQKMARRTRRLIYSVTFIPVSLFGLTQYPMYMAFKYRARRVLKTCKKLIRNRFTNKAGNNKYPEILY